MPPHAQWTEISCAADTRAYGHQQMAVKVESVVGDARASDGFCTAVTAGRQPWALRRLTHEFSGGSVVAGADTCGDQGVPYGEIGLATGR
jgi:hypothetical protein